MHKCKPTPRNVKNVQTPYIPLDCFTSPSLPNESNNIKNQNQNQNSNQLDPEIIERIKSEIIQEIRKDIKQFGNNKPNAVIYRKNKRVVYVPKKQEIEKVLAAVRKSPDEPLHVTLLRIIEIAACHMREKGML